MGVWKSAAERWLDAPKPEGMNKRSAKYFLHYKTIERMYTRNLTLLHFLIYRLDMEWCKKMYNGGLAQRRHITAVKIALKEYSLEQKWEPDFKRDLTNHRRRCNHVYRIIRENLRLTTAYLYFQAVGFERMDDFEYQYTEGKESDDRIAKAIEEWNDEHQEAVSKYMDSIAEERDAMIRHREETT